MKTFVMIPTYKERENLGPLITSIRDLGVEDLEIAIVDDNSPDGTAGLMNELMAAHGGIHFVLRKTNRGRGYAGAEGFKYCLAQGADYVIEMDADFSHDPRFIPQFLEKIRDYDLVIGSRFVKGAHNERGGLGRNLITSFARFYINTMLGVKLSDPTSGYRCFRRTVLQTINLDSMVSSGPAIVQEVLYKAHCCRFSMTEIPIIFQDRTRGKSTFNFRLAVQGFFMVACFRLLFKKPVKSDTFEVFKSSDFRK